MSKVVDRIGEIIAAKGLSVRAFEQSISASNGAIGRAVNKGSDIVASWLSKIIEIYPDVNAKWLLTGQGNMLQSDADTQTQIATAKPIDLPPTSNNDRLLSIIEDQQQTIKMQARTIEELTGKLGNDVPHLAVKAGTGGRIGSGEHLQKAPMKR